MPSNLLLYKEERTPSSAASAAEISCIPATRVAARTMEYSSRFAKITARSMRKLVTKLVSASKASSAPAAAACVAPSAAPAAAACAAPSAAVGHRLAAAALGRLPPLERPGCLTRPWGGGFVGPGKRCCAVVVPGDAAGVAAGCAAFFVFFAGGAGPSAVAPRLPAGGGGEEWRVFLPGASPWGSPLPPLLRLLKNKYHEHRHYKFKSCPQTCKACDQKHIMGRENSKTKSSKK